MRNLMICAIQASNFNSAFEQSLIACQFDLLLWPDEVESSRHAGEGRHPVSESNRRLGPGLRRGDEFKHYRAASIKSEATFRYQGLFFLAARQPGNA